MDLKSVAQDLPDQTIYRLQQRFEHLMHSNPSYRNLDEGNRRVIMELIEKYKEKLRHGIKPSRITVNEDMYRLYENRLRLKLTRTDLDQIRELLESFK